MSDQGWNLVDAAIQRGEAAVEQGNVAGLLDATALLESAAKHFAEPEFQALARGLTAIYFYFASIFRLQAGDRKSEKDYRQYTDSSRQNAERAIALDPSNFRGRLVLVWLASDQLKQMNIGVSDLAGGLNFGAQSAFRLMGRLAKAGIGQAQVTASRAAFNSRLTELLDIFEQRLETLRTPASEIIFFIDRLMVLGDFCRQNRLSMDEAKRLYRLLAEMDLEEDVVYDDIVDEYVEQVKEQLRQTLMLAKAHFDGM